MQVGQVALGQIDLAVGLSGFATTRALELLFEEFLKGQLFLLWTSLGGSGDLRMLCLGHVGLRKMLALPLLHQSYLLGILLVFIVVNGF